MEGRLVGFSLGESVGCFDGERVGMLEGDWVGRSVGDSDGLNRLDEGLVEGDIDGTWYVGLEEGSELGFAEVETERGSGPSFVSSLPYTISLHWRSMSVKSLPAPHWPGLLSEIVSFHSPWAVSPQLRTVISFQRSSESS